MFAISFSYIVPADSGLMGGSLNHEFLAVSAVGEDTLLVCPQYVQFLLNKINLRRKNNKD